MGEKERERRESERDGEEVRGNTQRKSVKSEEVREPDIGRHQYRETEKARRQEASAWQKVRGCNDHTNTIDTHTNTKQDTLQTKKAGGEENGVKSEVAKPVQDLVYACDKGCGFEAKSYAACEQHGTPRVFSRRLLITHAKHASTTYSQQRMKGSRVGGGHPLHMVDVVQSSTLMQREHAPMVQEDWSNVWPHQDHHHTMLHGIPFQQRQARWCPRLTNRHGAHMTELRVCVHAHVHAFRMWALAFDHKDFVAMA